MISDSPYEAGELILTSFEGIIGGLVGTLVMIVLATSLQFLSGHSQAEFLVRLGTAVSPFRLANDHARIAGLVVSATVGCLLGLLYAVCQQRIPVRGFVAVGLFYGFLLWVIGRILARWAFGGILHDVLRSGQWLGACLGYGLCLAMAAVLFAGRRAGRPSPVIPKD